MSTPPQTRERTLVTTRVAARTVGVAEGTLTRWSVRGDVRSAEKDGTGHWWDLDDLRRQLDRKQAQPAPINPYRMTTAQAAAELGVPIGTLRGWKRRGLMKPVREGRHSGQSDLWDLDELLRRLVNLPPGMVR